MATTNPNVPGQPVAAPAAPVAPAAPMQAVPVDSAKAAVVPEPPKAEAAKVGDTVTAAKAAAPAPSDLKAEDKSNTPEAQFFKQVDEKSSGLPYFEQQEEFGKAFEEKEGESSGRRQRRIEREQDAVASEGDPTRDPVAKQQAMDRTVVEPGAVENAKAIKEEGKKHYEDQSHAFRGVK